MLLLGVLLLMATVAFTALVISDNHTGLPDYRVSLFGKGFATMNTLEVFLAGIAIALLLAVAVMLTASGSMVAWRRQAKLRAARTEVRRATEERDELRTRLDESLVQTAAAEREAEIAAAAPTQPDAPPGPAAAKPAAAKPAKRPGGGSTPSGGTKALPKTAAKAAAKTPPKRNTTTGTTRRDRTATRMRQMFGH
ncbi:hypothetical protein [Yinghuangia seranimata]|uniref:hypothetical protein n=1 Tax=Yinghuangia seranimata TaxID=408067 RepID=UPI00248B34CF|nr:hypothetical protein [Yinghuangia seranimata]MDI2129658.1 hypothetical protein [Yinghuangia seranimata]